MPALVRAAAAAVLVVFATSASARDGPVVGELASASCPLSRVNSGGHLGCNGSVTNHLFGRHELRWYGPFSIADPNGMFIALDTCATHAAHTRMTHQLLLFDGCPIFRRPIATTGREVQGAFRCGAGGVTNHFARLHGLRLRQGYDYYAMIDAVNDDSHRPDSWDGNYTLSLTCSSARHVLPPGIKKKPRTIPLSPPEAFNGLHCRFTPDMINATVGCNSSTAKSIAWAPGERALIQLQITEPTMLTVDACHVSRSAVHLTGYTCNIFELERWFDSGLCSFSTPEPVLPGKYMLGVVADDPIRNSTIHLGCAPPKDPRVAVTLLLSSSREAAGPVAASASRAASVDIDEPPRRLGLLAAVTGIALVALGVALGIRSVPAALRSALERSARWQQLGNGSPADAEPLFEGARHNDEARGLRQSLLHTGAR